MTEWKVGDEALLGQDTRPPIYRGRRVRLVSEMMNGWNVVLVHKNEMDTPMLYANRDNLFPTAEGFKLFDRVRITKRLGPEAGQEGVVQGHGGGIASDYVRVVLDGGEDYNVHAIDLVVIDPAPKAQATALNALYKEIGEEGRRLSNVGSDVTDYGMKGLRRELDAHAEILYRFQNKLYFALREDGLLDDETV